MAAPSASTAATLYPEWVPREPLHVPGPGHYDVSAPREVRGNSFGSAPRLLHAAAAGPGPGSYQLDHALDGSKKTPPAFSFGLPYRAGADTAPAPNAYHPHDAATATTGPAFTFGQRMPPAHDTITPGPAAYDPATSAPVPAPLLAPRPRAAAPSAGPGPGKYFGDVEQRRSPGFSFRTKPVVVAEDLPGV